MKNTLLIVRFCLIILLCQCTNREELHMHYQKSEDIVKSPWGIEFNPLTPHITYYRGDWNPIQLNEKIDKMVTEANELGIKWVRFSINWSTVQNDDSTFDFDYVDRVINGLIKEKIEVMICLNGGHRKFTQAISVKGEKEMVAWLKFLEQMTMRYKEKVRYWEIWNEPNGIWFWKPAPCAKDYVELVKQSSQLIRKNIPEAVIVGGSLARLDLPFADSLARYGIDKYVNVISFHPYNEFPEAIVRKMQVPVKTPVQYMEPDHSVYQLKELFEPKGVKVWQAECGYPSAANGTGWNGNGPWGEQIQGKWILRRMLTDLFFGSDISVYFCFTDNPENGNNSNTKGLLRRKTLERKPAFYVLRNLANLINGNIIPDSEQKLEITSIKDEGGFKGFRIKDVFSFSFTKNSQSKFIAYWLPWRMQEITTGATIQLTTSGIEDPVLIDLLNGKITKPVIEKSDSGKLLITLPLMDYPLLITDKSEITKNQ